jgi:hypothetical protein
MMLELNIYMLKYIFYTQIIIYLSVNNVSMDFQASKFSLLWRKRIL